MNKRLLITLASVVVGVIILATIIIVLTVNGLNASIQEADYRQCLEAYGMYDTTDTSKIMKAAETCYSATYGE